MRIIAGTHRGRILVAPKGHSTRPTADRVRQALFDVLEHASWSLGLSGLRVIDLFAGSGALGLEALSRGASFCLFVDQDGAAVEAVTRNLEGFSLSARAWVERRDATRLHPAGPASGAPFDLAFLDPPYGRGLAAPALDALLSGGWLAPDASVIVEQGLEERDLAAPNLESLDSRRWGAAQVAFLRPASADRTGVRYPQA